MNISVLKYLPEGRRAVGGNGKHPHLQVSEPAHWSSCLLAPPFSWRKGVWTTGRMYGPSGLHSTRRFLSVTQGVFLATFVE